MRAARSIAFIIVGAICLASAAGLAGYNAWDADRAGKTAAEGLSALVQQIDAARADAADEVALTLPPSQQPVKQMPTSEVDGRVYVGMIEIPSFGVSLPVLAEWSYDNLKIAPCYYAGNCYTNDLVLCAHNYSTHFNGLRWVDMGADVYFTTVEGETFHYAVVNRETLNPEEVERLKSPDADWDLTLFTCYVGGATRCVVRCELVD